MSHTKTIELSLSPEQGMSKEELSKIINSKFGKQHFLLKKRSIDARKKNIKVNCRVEIADQPLDRHTWKPNFPKIKPNSQLAIIGCGPAGMFAAIQCLELGIRPIIYERGKDVQSRRRDLAKLNREELVDPNSNYCFGEGGAGTYSDGKLYTRSTKRGDVNRILEILFYHGAPEEILFESHPHIGTNKLPKVVQSMRETIIAGGGEIHFGEQMTNLRIVKESIKEIQINNEQWVDVKGLILATGHSARDIYELLYDRNVLIELKPFALGVRIEHPQNIIDQAQYHSPQGKGDYLPPASYSLKRQVNHQRSVFSFCMCPGGFIVPSATAEGELVVNGMSPSKRNSLYANSGTVVGVDERDFTKFERFGPLAAMYYQKEVEQIACEYMGGGQKAPAQLLPDFIANKNSKNLNKTSYIPGLGTADFKEILPEPVRLALWEGVKAFGAKMKGYYTKEAQLIGIESRTSAPVRIPRSAELNHPQIINLFPSGEGAGFAGGIVSAALDGSKVAESAARIF